MDNWRQTYMPFGASLAQRTLVNSLNSNHSNWSTLDSYLTSCVHVITYVSEDVTLGDWFRVFRRNTSPSSSVFLALCRMPNRVKYGRCGQRWMEDRFLRNVRNHSDAASSTTRQENLNTRMCYVSVHTFNTTSTYSTRTQLTNKTCNFHVWTTHLLRNTFFVILHSSLVLMFSSCIQNLSSRIQSHYSRRTAEEADIIFTASSFIEEQQIQDTTRNCNKT
jgi:hypothetical protein